MPTEEKKKYAPQARYDAKNTKRIVLKLNIKTDADILAKLDVEQLKLMKHGQTVTRFILTTNPK